MKTKSLRAKWLFPVDQPPIENGVVTIDCETERIVALGPATVGRDAEDLGEVALIPALVNAHTHLEFSDLEAPLGSAGNGFAAWIRSVIDRRRAIQAEGDETERVIRAISRGLGEAAASGCAALGEIMRPGIPAAAYIKGRVECVLFLELLGLAMDRESALLPMAEAHVEKSRYESFDHLLPALSPHAPYTVSPTLVQKACEISQRTGAPLAMHLAESWDEIELLQSHSGPLVELLSDLGAWHPERIPRGIEPRQYLEWLAMAKRALVIHGNYLQPDDWQFLAAHRDRMTLVHCPRTHAFFQRGTFPIQEIVADGVRVALGTDSRSSNPDLNLFAEMQHLRAVHRELPGEAILQLGTLNGAEALELNHHLGSISVGKAARLAVVELDSETSEPLHDRLFAPGSRIRPLDMA